MQSELETWGVARLPGLLSGDALAALQKAARACFEAIEAGGPIPERYRWNRFSNSVVLPALLDFGCSSLGELLDPLARAGLEPAACRMQDSWVRKKGPPHFYAHTWHQDGALGVRFPPDPGEPVPMTPLLTLWIPLDPCGNTAPGLEFVRRPLSRLLHFTELDDAGLRARFAPEDFWAP